MNDAEENFIPAKKSLGQNFLKSKKTLDDIIDAGTIDTHDIIVEAGPGKGALTERLLGCARQIIAIEKDERLVMYNRFKFINEIASEKLKLISGDVLEFNPESENLQNGGYKIIANIPYYITGQFLRRFLSEVIQPSKIVVLLQREVVTRIMAEDGRESLLSLSIKCYGKPKSLGTVKARYFSPPPAVDSAILLVEDISKKFFVNVDEKFFFEVLKIGFGQKRKKLIGNLSNKYPRTTLEEIFKRADISENARAENLTPYKWKILAQNLAKTDVLNKNILPE